MSRRFNHEKSRVAVSALSRRLELRIDGMFEVWNPRTGKKVDRYVATTKRLVKCVQEEARKRNKLRAIGSGWSLSRVLLTEGSLLDTTQLNLFFRVGKTFLYKDYPERETQRLYLSQCGVSIKSLHERLFKENPKRSLRTAGSSDGQTIVGALSTGTHGSGVDEAPLQDGVAGIHLIIGGRRKHVWLERDSNPVVTEKFVTRLGAETKGQLNKEVEKRYGPCGPAWGTLGEIFGAELHKGAVISAAVAMPAKFALAALELAFDEYDKIDFFPGLISVRFARESRATLAFTRFRKTCVFEIDGVSTPLSRRRNVFKRIEAAGIPHAFHWGKMHGHDEGPGQDRLRHRPCRVEEGPGNAAGNGEPAASVLERLHGPTGTD